MVIIQSSLETLKWIIITSDLHAKMTCVVHVIQKFRKKNFLLLTEKKQLKYYKRLYALF